MRLLRIPLLILTLIVVVGAAGFLLLRPAGGPGEVRRVEKPDPALLHAINQAQKGLPEFLKELRHPQSGQKFAIMARFRTPDGNEYLWVKNPEISGKGLRGTLDQQPISAPVHKGDAVTVSQADVVDWLIRDPDGSQRGQFTVPAGGS